MNAFRLRVRRRGAERCEYRGLRQKHSELKHHIEHVIAKQHGGSDDAGNLALACHRCNLRKGTNLTGIDPQTGQVSRLFHPRRDRWPDHFIFEGALIAALTSVGRATMHVLGLNDARHPELRTEVMRRGPLT